MTIARPTLRLWSAAVLAFAVMLPAACKKKPSPPAAQAPATPPPDSAAHAGAATDSQLGDPDSPPEWLEHPQITPGTTVMTVLDPQHMTPSEIQFGVAPKLSKDVDYRPDVIIMEEGDKAIRSVGTDGLTWTFDAAAPHVSEFQEGRIVFATGRSVGRILALKREGGAVAVILGPVQLTDLIKRGRFVMDQPIDPANTMAYVAPAYPSAIDSEPATPSRTSGTDGAAGSPGETGIFSNASNDRWTTASMWAMAQQLPSWPQGVPRVPKNPVVDRPPIKAAGAVPEVNITENGGDLRTVIVGNNTYMGLQYYYNKNGLHADASGLVNFQTPRIRCVLTFKDSGIDSAGIDIQGAAGIKLELASRSPQETFTNIHLRKWVPIDVTIPLGGPVPFALNFATLFDINSGFSAKSSLMAAEGEYTFNGHIWAGVARGKWQVAVPSKVTTAKSLAGSAGQLSLGINTLSLAFALRSMVGVGAFGFNTGVFARVKFDAGLLLAPNQTWPCRQAAVDIFVDSGIGYQMPKWVADPINLLLRPLTRQAIDPVGTIATFGQSPRLFHDDTQIPSGCSTRKSG